MHSRARGYSKAEIISAAKQDEEAAEETDYDIFDANGLCNRSILCPSTFPYFLFPICICDILEAMAEDCKQCSSCYDYCD